MSEIQSQIDRCRKEVFVSGQRQHSSLDRTRPQLASLVSFFDYDLTQAYLAGDGRIDLDPD